ncbi:hypothetical protein D3C87_1776530 [compost metagenome]
MNTEGKMRFISVSGENSEAIAPALQQMIDKMDLWKPTRENGRTFALVLDLRFSITEHK